MRILIVTDAWEPQVNGVVRTLKTTARELTKMGHEVQFLTPLDAGSEWQARKALLRGAVPAPLTGLA